MTVLVEGFDPDALALARFLAREGKTVRLAGPADEPDEAAALRELGIRVDPHTDLATDSHPVETAYLDVWTPDTAPRVQRLRAQGARVSCLGDFLLERWRGPTIGITGTAGKTTTTTLVASILRAAGLDVAVSSGARAGNLWPTADLLDQLDHPQAARADGNARPLLLELTSSHLAFMHRSPTLAAVISFWPDHLELHGGLDRYRAAKATIVCHQHEGDTVVVNADDASSTFAALSPARRVAFSLTGAFGEGAYLDRSRGVVLVDRTGGETELGAIHSRAAHPGNVVAAAAIAAAAGVDAAAIAAGTTGAEDLPWRAQRQGTLDGVPVLDDGMAATPRKTTAAIAGYPPHSIVLIAGGMRDAGGGTVHANPEEQAVLAEACEAIARTARLVVAFGEAGPQLAALLRERGADVVSATGLDDAVATAAATIRATPGATRALVFSPLFPVSLDDRARFAELVRSHA